MVIGSPQILHVTEGSQSWGCFCCQQEVHQPLDEENLKRPPKRICNFEVLVYRICIYQIGFSVSQIILSNTHSSETESLDVDVCDKENWCLKYVFWHFSIDFKLMEGAKHSLTFFLSFIQEEGVIIYWCYSVVFFL